MRKDSRITVVLLSGSWKFNALNAIFLKIVQSFPLYQKIIFVNTIISKTRGLYWYYFLARRLQKLRNVNLNKNLKKKQSIA
jgi:hypothetical protein